VKHRSTDSVKNSELKHTFKGEKNIYIQQKEGRPILFVTSGVKTAC